VLVLVRATHTTKEAPRGYQQHQPGRAHRQPDRRSGPALAAERHVGLQAARGGQHAPQGLGHRRDVDKPNDFDVVVWGAQGEACARYLAKGRPAAIDGHVEWREWQVDDGGAKRQAVEVIADVVQFLAGHRRDENDAAGQAAAVPDETS
jgi:single-strand DNA-binding protein